MTTCDVVVAGAGPAGAVAAGLLARAGLSVVLVDRPRSGVETIGETLPSPDISHGRGCRHWYRSFGMSGFG